MKAFLDSELDILEKGCYHADVLEEGMKLYDKREVCTLLKISLSKLNGLLRTGEIVAKKIGSRILFTEQDIKNFIDALPEYESSGSHL